MIQLNGFGWRHAGRRAWALRDLDLRIERGERVLLLGPSGAGKSTILALLLGFVTPATGRITVDDIDLAAMDLDEWRRRITWVPQRPHLFTATIADNIRLGMPAATPSDVDKAVSDAGLWATVEALPDGLSTVLGEGGHGLSSGQRQRVALARAFLRSEAGLLLFDEPTARLDGATETAVLEATARLSAGRTAVLVAHRPALLATADRILRVHIGRIDKGVPA